MVALHMSLPGFTGQSSSLILDSRLPSGKAAGFRGNDNLDAIEVEEKERC